MARGKRMTVANLNTQVSFHEAVRRRRARMDAAGVPRRARTVRHAETRSRWSVPDDGYYRDDMETPGTPPTGMDASAAGRSEEQKLPTLPLSDFDEPVVRSMDSLIRENGEAAWDDYRRGDYSSRSFAELGRSSWMIWANKFLPDLVIPSEFDPYNIIAGRRMLALAGLASAERSEPVLSCEQIEAHMAQADAEGRYGEAPLRAPSPTSGERAVDADPNADPTQDDDIADLVAAAERELERLTPTYEKLRGRVAELADLGEGGTHPEFNDIRAEAAAAYSPLAHIALKAELARQTALYRGDRSSDRFRLILSLTRELSFSFAALAAAKSQNDEQTLGIGQQSLIEPEEIAGGLASD